MVGQGEYNFPADLSVIDYESFYLKSSTSLNTSGGALGVLEHDNYLRHYDQQMIRERQQTLQNSNLIFKTQQQKFGVTPTPDKAYQIEYKYWSFPADLSAATDTPSIPDRFKHVIVEGAMVYLMRFRSNEQSAAMHEKKFEEGIDIMRRLLQQPVASVTSVISRNNTYAVNL